jgi:EmrB/QacA subfamily drug resistance transporter
LAPNSSPALGRGARWLALGVLSAGQLMIILDQTIVNVALRSIQSDLAFSQSSLAWVVNAYLIAFAGTLLLAGRLGDLIGRKRIFVIGLLGFTVASLLCGLAGTQELLVAARFAQGVGGATASAVVLGMIVTLFRDPREQAQAVGFTSFIGAAGASIGVLAGGVITQNISWHWIFFVNVPIGLLATAMAVRLLAPDRGIGLGAGADVWGAILVTAGLMLGVYAIVEVTDYGWSSWHTLGFGGLAVALLVAFVAREAQAANPLLPLRMFRSRALSGASFIQALVVAGLFGFQFLSVLYLQRVLGYDALTTGLASVPIALVIGSVSLGLSARLTTRFSARSVLITGLTLLAASLALLARAPVDGVYVVDVLPAFLLLGVGGGLAFPSLMTLAMSGATSSDAGLASGVVTTSTQVGGAFGLAVLATLATAQSDGLLAGGQSAAAALTGGYQLAFGIGAGLILAGLVLAVLVLRPAPAAQPRNVVRAVRNAAIELEASR